MKYFLGIEISTSSKGICLSQRRYTLELLSDSGLAGTKPSAVPVEQDLKLTSKENDEIGNSNHEDRLLDDPTSYQRLEKSTYLIMTRSDISYSVHVLSQFMHAPKYSHMNSAMKVLRYIKSSPGLGLLLTKTSKVEVNLL